MRVESRPSAADRRLYQDPAQANWGAPLEPGLYSVITEELVRQSCILVIEPDLWDVVGETGDLVSISGVA